MRMFQVVYVTGEKFIAFANHRADVWYKHPKAWRVFEVVIK